MKILLICKGEYRYFFPAIARELAAAHGCKVSALAFTTAATRVLERSGAFAEVHNIAAFLKARVPQLSYEESVSRLSRLEATGQIDSLNTMIHADRILREYPFELSMTMLAAVAEFWKSILEAERPAAIMGEIGCATEWLAWCMARNMGIEFLVPYPTPVAQRFFFIDSPAGNWEPMERCFADLERRGLTREEERAAEDFVQMFRARKAKPPFLSWALRSPLIPDFPQLRRRIARIPFRILTSLEDGHYEIGSYHGTSPWRPVWEDSVRIVRYSLAEAAILEKSTTAGPYVYFPLHVQPEFTTDVRAPFFTNQPALIENISKCVPAGYRVVVKEHPSMKGERNLGYYLELKKIHNIELLSPRAESHALIHRAGAVLTITGSSAWEAILYEKPVIAFGPLCYGFCKLIYACDNIADLPSVISEAIQRFKPDHSLLLKFVWSLMASGYRLNWGDPIRMPEVKAPQNVAEIASAICQEILTRQESSLAQKVAV